jgi:hypothetical protein
MVAMMLTYQPLIMGGIDDYKKATSNAYGAMATFIFTFLVSVVYLIQDALTPSSGEDNRDTARRRRSGNNYEGIPQGGSLGPAVLNDYALNLDLPPSVQEGVYS